MRKMAAGFPLFFGSYVGSTLCKTYEIWTTVYIYSVDRKEKP